MGIRGREKSGKGQEGFFARRRKARALGKRVREKAQSGRKTLRRLAPAGRLKRVLGKEEPTRPLENLRSGAMKTLQQVGSSSREAFQGLKERIPESASRARDWTSERIAAHPVAFATGALAAGVVGAALIPLSDAERRGFRLAGSRLRAVGQMAALSQLGRVRELLRGGLERLGSLPEELETEEEERPAAKEAKQEGQKPEAKKTRSKKKSSSGSSKSRSKSQGRHS